MDGKLKAYTNLFIHWDSNYWYAFYVFLLLQGSFIVAFTQIFLRETINNRLIFLTYISISGCVLSIIWLFVMNRKMTYTYGAEEELKKKIPEIWISTKNKQIFSFKKPNTYFTFIPSSLLIRTVFPLLFFVFWLISLRIFH